MIFFFFFFSSRRRHTRCSRDWSSDVCSSDLMLSLGVQMISGLLYTRGLVVADYSATSFFNIGWILGFALQQWAAETQVKRSEERRVGKEWRSRWSPDH